MTYEEHGGAPPDDAAWKKLDFVIGWQSLSTDEKHRYLSEYGSHEFHFFIKMKDPEYFNAIVRGVLTNKMEKSLFDHFLLDNHAEVVASYGKPHLV